MRARHLAAERLGQLRAVVAERGGDHGRVRDALERATHDAVLEREAERVGRDLLQPVRFIDDQMLRGRQQRATPPRVLEQERVVRHDKP